MGILVKNQFNELREALDKAFVSQAVFDDMLLTIGEDREAVTVGVGQSKPAIISAVIRAAESEGWTRALIGGAAAANPGAQELQTFIANHPEHDPAKPPPVRPNYYESLVLIGGQVFLRRQEIRKNLQKIGVDNNSRVMAITGPRLTGKTYSRDFITYVLENDPAQKQLTQKVAYVDLDKYPPGPREIAKRIGKKLGLDEGDLPEDKGEQAARLLPDLVDYITEGVASHAADVVWIVLDGFYSKQPPESDDLMTSLIKEANRTPKLRVVLLNYKLPELIAPFTLKEEIEPEPFNRDHMNEFIEFVYQHRGKPYDASSVNKAVDDVIRQVNEQLNAKPEDKDRRLEYLSAGLAVAAQRLSS